MVVGLLPGCGDKKASDGIPAKDKQKTEKHYEGDGHDQSKHEKKAKKEVEHKENDGHDHSKH